jgi:hypothetical protein
MRSPKDPSTQDHESALQGDFPGSGDLALGESELYTRFRRHADGLERSGRSPLSIALMRGAADSLEHGGIVSALFSDIALPAGQAPALRLLAALHRLVLTDRAPELARYYPSVGGEASSDTAWPVAERTLERNASSVRTWLRRSVQTNEPGRSAVLFGVLLWAVDRYDMPVRLLEIGASAGLNLLAPHYGYRVEGQLIGDPRSPLVFDEPWSGAPVDHPVPASSRLVVTERRGCDIAPVDANSDDGRVTLASYIWPDEPNRLARVRAAIAVAKERSAVVERSDAASWLEAMRPHRPQGVVEVLWQSVFSQYLSQSEYDRIRDRIADRGSESQDHSPLVWARMEPALDPTVGMVTTLTCWPGEDETTLAISGDHGPPVRWVPGSA